MIKIEDDDIKGIEEKFKVKFDKERKIAIKNLSDTDFVACAGSGKTTMMCAKIDILTNKQPIIGNKGIAVLSLTNVAIEQIKDKLGGNHKIFKYPNYCETIQKFVTKFVLNNWYNSKYKKKIEIIDNEFFYQKIRQKLDFKKVSYLDNVNFLFEEVYTDGEDVYYNDIKIEDKKISKLSVKKNEEYINSIKTAKLELINEGIFNYRDAFEISTKYLKNNIRMKEYIRQRFEICFVDEMQDCRKWEKEFLEEFFSNICFQRIGDPNQQIYDETYWKPTDAITINNSIRNSVNIAEFAKKFEETPNEMTGNIQNGIKVKMLVYKCENILKVKEKYVEEIKKERLNEKERPIFKMIGKVAKRNLNGKIELSDFCNCTEEKTINIYNKLFLENFKKNKNNIVKTIVDMMYYLYKKIDKYNFEKIFNKEDFISRIDKFIDKEDLYDKLKYNKGEIYEFSKTYSKNILINIFTNKKYFIEMYNKFIEEEISENNVMKLIEDEIKIEVKTIAGVKGETHTATLVCETFYKNYDMEYIIDNYIKQNKKNKTIVDLLHSLYVAFTRPTDMLCIAIREEVYKKFKEEIDALDVEIINI